ncbi:MAG: tetratricopeptide repeat protein [Acidobacteriaceae bacterium]|nr:tetratricopeptide repeat protein [Acidobacteriaceae bacterium]
MAQAVPPSTPQAVYERGQAYWNSSLQAFSQLQKTAPGSAYAFALLGEERAKKGHYTAAVEAFTEAAARMPELRGVHSAMADVYLASGQPAKASEAEAAEQKLGPPDCRIEKTQCDFSAGRFDDVVQAAKLKGKPESLYWLARAYQQLAIQSFGQLSNLPESSELHKVKAQLLRQEHKYRESIEEWRAALKLSPGDPSLQSELAASLFLNQDYEGILPELQQLLKAQPDSANLNFFVGDSLLETQQAEQAVPYLETALRLDPKLLPAEVALGLAYVHLREPQKAIPHLKAGLELDQTGRLYYLLARAYRATGQPELAKEMMDKYQQLQRAVAPSGGSAR